MKELAEEILGYRMTAVSMSEIQCECFNSVTNLNFSKHKQIALVCNFFVLGICLLN